MAKRRTPDERDLKVAELVRRYARALSALGMLSKAVDELAETAGDDLAAMRGGWARMLAVNARASGTLAYLRKWKRGALG
jgi:hypothetical protein